MSYTTARRLTFVTVALGALVVAAAIAVAGEPQLEQVVAPRRRLGKRLLFVVDVSGSMRGVKIAQALAFVRQTAEQPTDELEVAVLAFRTETTRWPTRGFAALPDVAKLAELEAWLALQVASGDTLAIPALRQASGEAGVSVVLVSDGIFQREAVEDVAASWRGKGALACYGVGARSEALAQLAVRGGGGYWRAGGR